MKKLLLCLLTVAGPALFCSFKQANVSNLNLNGNNNEEVVLAKSTTWKVSCVKFSDGLTIRTEGHYDPDTNTIKIAGKTYRVQENPYYGDGTKRGKYNYRAGDYFFDL